MTLDFYGLEAATIRYFQGIEAFCDNLIEERRNRQAIQINKQDNERAIDSELLLCNVYKEIAKREVRLSFHNETSRVLEKYLLLCSDETLLSYFEALLGSICKMATQRFASHVLQAVFKRTLYVIYGCSGSGEEQIQMKNQAIRLCNGVYQEIRGSFFDLAADTFASHPIRQFLCILGCYCQFSGMESEKTKEYKKNNLLLFFESQPTQKQKILCFEEKLSEIQGFCVDLCKSHAQKLFFHKMGSLVFQLLLKILCQGRKERNAWNEQEELPKFLAGRFACNTVNEKQSKAARSLVKEIERDPVGSRALECIIEALSNRQVGNFYKNFSGRIVKMLANQYSCYVLIALTRKVSEVEFHGILAELTPIVSSKRCDIYLKTLVHIAAAAIRLQKHFQKVIHIIRGSISCQPNPKEELIAILCWKAQPEDKQGSEGNEGPKKKKPKVISEPQVNDRPKEKKITAFGCNLFSYLVHFPTDLCGKLVKEFVVLLSTEFGYLSCNKYASRVVEAIIAAEEHNIPEIRQLISENAFTLACDASGSHVLESFWSACDLCAKEEIAEEMCKRRRKLDDSVTARILWQKFHLNEYENNIGNWRVKVAPNRGKKEEKTK